MFNTKDFVKNYITNSSSFMNVYSEKSLHLLILTNLTIHYPRFLNYMMGSALHFQIPGCEFNPILKVKKHIIISHQSMHIHLKCSIHATTDAFLHFLNLLCVIESAKYARFCACFKNFFLLGIFIIFNNVFYVFHNVNLLFLKRLVAIYSFDKWLHFLSIYFLASAIPRNFS